MSFSIWMTENFGTVALKIGGNSCRYKIPQVPISKTSAKPVFSDAGTLAIEEESFNRLSPNTAPPQKKKT